MDEDARAPIGQPTRYEPTHAVRRASDQHGFVLDVHATKDRQNLVDVPEMRGPYDLKQFPARSYRCKKHPNVAAVMNPEIIQHYHAHVYYDPVSSRDRAARLRERVAAAFPGVTLGRWHDTPVGPHTQAMYQ